MSLLLLLAATAVRVDHPQTFLLSIQNIPLRRGDRVEAFSFSTWGVQFDAVCHVPPGWTVTAGGSLTPEGTLKAEGSLGVTWFMRGTPQELNRLALVTLYGPAKRRDSGVEPATFKGSATLWNDDSDRKVKLTFVNVRLTPARHCPA